MNWREVVKTSPNSYMRFYNLQVCIEVIQHDMTMELLCKMSEKKVYHNFNLRNFYVKVQIFLISE